MDKEGNNMAFCTNCSKEIQADWKVCPFCGTPNVLSVSDNKKDNNSTSLDSSGTYGANEGNQSTIMDTAGGYGLDLSNLAENTIIDKRYKILEKLGSGGFGTVYRAWDTVLEVDKALKIIHKDVYSNKEAIINLKKEAKLLYTLKHPNIVDFHEIHLQGEIKYFDMELISGGDLVDFKMKHGAISEETLLPLMKQIIAGMIKIHDSGIIHKDLKPANIMLTDKGIVKIMDFGISETLKTSMSRLSETSRSGTAVYQSPEHLNGKQVGKESDIWSFGVLCYEILSGNPVFRGETWDDVKSSIKGRLDVDREGAKLKQFGRIEPLEGVSEKLNSVLGKCLRWAYEERFNDFKEIREYLDKAGTPEVFDIMVFVEGGTFMMGNDYFLTSDVDERPEHKVTLDSFYISKYQLTFAEYDKYCEATGIENEDWGHDDRPVINVSWYDAVKYCNWHSIEEGFLPFYIFRGDTKIWDYEEDDLDKNSAEIKINHSSNGYRLPTEAEWEFAARGGNKSKGYLYSGSNNLLDVATNLCNSDFSTSSVGERQPNELNLYDMSGNVCEWCWDWYKAYTIDPQTNPTGPASGTYRVNRGGSFRCMMVFCTVSYRISDTSPNSVDSGVGFRLARSPVC